MVKYKEVIIAILILFFLLFSFYPTIFELSRANKLTDPNREFILEHNYYWPDFNLYLSKIRQGFERRFLAVEKYTSEPHQGSLIQEFYLVLGILGRTIGLDPNLSYQLGRLILSPILLIIIWLLVKYYFHSHLWQLLGFIIVIVSGSFPRFYTDPQGVIQVGRFMEWWSNIDSLQRITFIPHILFGQVFSFFLLYQLINIRQITYNRLPVFVILGNFVGLVFPPSLITLNGVILIIIFLRILNQLKYQRLNIKYQKYKLNIKNIFNFLYVYLLFDILYLIFSSASLLYLFFITKQLPWSALIEFHKTHPMMIPFDQYILGTGPIFFLGTFGAILSIIKRERRFQPLILWVITTLGFASFFSVVKEQSPLRFTQTGLFIPLGILGTYFFQSLFRLSLGQRPIVLWTNLSYLLISLYILGNLFIMKISLNWQTDWIAQRIGANIPPVPYPPQTVYPLKDWMNGVRWLRDNTNHEDVVLAEITAGNYIPAYSGNTVYFGQSNTVDYERKQKEVDKFFSGKMTPTEAEIFLKRGRIKYVFFSVQEKEKAGGKILETIYPFLKSIFNNNLVTIYKYES